MSATRELVEKTRLRERLTSISCMIFTFLGLQCFVSEHDKNVKENFARRNGSIISSFPMGLTSKKCWCLYLYKFVFVVWFSCLIYRFFQIVVSHFSLPSFRQFVYWFMTSPSFQDRIFWERFISTTWTFLSSIVSECIFVE